jgi:transcriptional regulator with XRE-family HTH domain
VSNDQLKARSLGAVIGAGVKALRLEQELTQDELARRLRNVGLDWDQGAVARLEAGGRGVSPEQELLLAWALGVERYRLVAGEDDQWVTLSPRARWRIAAVRSAYAGANPGDMPAGDFEDPVKRSARRAAGAILGRAEQRAAASKLWPRATVAQLNEVVEAVGDAERKAARHLGVDPVTVSAAAHRKWGRSFTAERDTRAADLVEEGAGRRALQALRGHVTRQLLAELAPILEEKR